MQIRGRQGRRCSKRVAPQQVLLGKLVKWSCPNCSYQLRRNLRLCKVHRWRHVRLRHAWRRSSRLRGSQIRSSRDCGKETSCLSIEWHDLQPRIYWRRSREIGLGLRGLLHSFFRSWLHQPKSSHFCYLYYWSEYVFLEKNKKYMKVKPVWNFLKIEKIVR